MNPLRLLRNCIGTERTAVELNNLDKFVMPCERVSRRASRNFGVNVGHLYAVEILEGLELMKDFPAGARFDLP